MAIPHKKAYAGRERKLVIAIDVGTTFSGVSYAFLIPGEPPTTQGITRRLAEILKYQAFVTMKKEKSSLSAQKLNPELWEVEGLFRAEWFKLHLQLPYPVAEQELNMKDMPPLLPGKTAIDVFGDLLRYLYASTMQYIRERQGNTMFESVSANIGFVLSHPNGWEGKQQFDMRRAAIAAGLVEDMSDALKHISFVTEGEACLHFCLDNVPSAVDEYDNDGFLVLDCGGGTVDISTYARSSNGHFREIAAAECLLQGSIFVTRRAQAYLTEKLLESRYGGPEDIDIMTTYFDRTTKPSFKGSSKPYFIRFGRTENDPQFDIRNGSIKINGLQIAKFFEPAVRSIIQVIEEQSRKSSNPIKAIFMVGGFGTSDYLFSKLNEHFNQRGINILRPDSHLNKAVAEGAISYKLDHSVTDRIARYTYGAPCCPQYDSDDPEHIARKHTRFTLPSGRLVVPGYFQAILENDTEVFEGQEFRKTFRRTYTEEDFHRLSMTRFEILCYRDRRSKPPAWIDQAPDISELKKSAKLRRNKDRIYYDIDLDIIILFGLTEFKAQIAWRENGVEKRGPASIIYDITFATDS